MWDSFVHQKLRKSISKQIKAEQEVIRLGCKVWDSEASLEKQRNFMSHNYD